MQSDNQMDAPKFGFTSGIAFCCNFSKRLGIETGIQYSNKGFRTKEDALIFGGAPPRRGSTSILPPIKSGHFVYNYHYIDIPLKVHFVLGKKRVRFVGGIGICTNIFIAANNVFVGKEYDGKTIRISSKGSYFNNYNEINFSPVVSLGVDYKINKKTNLRVEPSFKYALLPTQNSPITAYLWSGGLNISYYFGL